MPLSLAFADPNYLDIATKQRVTEEVKIKMNNLELYIGCHMLDNALSGSPPNLLLEASKWVGETD